MALVFDQEAIVARVQGRAGWLREAKRQLDDHRQSHPRPVPRDRLGRLLACEQRLVEDLAVEREANQAYEAYRARGVMKNGRRFGGPPKAYVPPAEPVGKVNTSDPDSKNVKAFRGYVQGYNAQAVVTEQQIVIAAELNTDPQDFSHLAPMFNAAQRELASVGVTEQPEVVVADAGYWHFQQMDELAAQGVTVLIPPDSTKRKDARPGWDGGRYSFMRLGPRQRPRPPALQEAPHDDRAGVRPDQVQPQDRPVPTKRQISRTLRMASGGRHTQPHEAPPPPTHRLRGLTTPLRPRRRLTPSDDHPPDTRSRHRPTFGRQRSRAGALATL